MDRLLSPACMLLAIVMLIAGFALWAVEPPEPGIELHRALAVGDDDYRDALEARLQQRVYARRGLLICLFGGSLLMTLAAFATQRGSGPS